MTYWISWWLTSLHCFFAWVNQAEKTRLLALLENAMSLRISSSDRPFEVWSGLSLVVSSGTVLGASMLHRNEYFNILTDSGYPHGTWTMEIRAVWGGSRTRIAVLGHGHWEKETDKDQAEKADLSVVMYPNCKQHGHKVCCEFSHGANRYDASSRTSSCCCLDGLSIDRFRQSKYDTYCTCISKYPIGIEFYLEHLLYRTLKFWNDSLLMELREKVSRPGRSRVVKQRSAMHLPFRERSTCSSRIV